MVEAEAHKDVLNLDHFLVTIIVITLNITIIAVFIVWKSNRAASAFVRLEKSDTCLLLASANLSFALNISSTILSFLHLGNDNMVLIKQWWLIDWLIWEWHKNVYDGNTCDVLSDCVAEGRNSRKISHLDNSKKNNNQMSNCQGYNCHRKRKKKQTIQTKIWQQSPRQLSCAEFG